MTLAVLESAEVRTKRLRLFVPSVVLAVATMWLLWLGESDLDSHRQLGAALAAGRAELVAPIVLAVVALMLVCERMWPAEPRSATARGPIHDGLFFALHLAIVVPMMTLLGFGFAHLLAGPGRWVSPTWSAGLPRWLILGVTLGLMDGCNWLAHWADHRFNVLWRMHALHHTQEEVSVLTSFRAHPLAHFMGFFLSTVPVIVVLGDQSMLPVLVSVYVAMSTLTHANVNWTLGPLGKVVVSPAYHRLHHSIDEPTVVNLGVVLTVWDVLAGRARFPQPAQAPCRTGLAGRPLITEQAGRRPGHVPLLLKQLVEPFTVRSSTVETL